MDCYKSWWCHNLSLTHAGSASWSSQSITGSHESRCSLCCIRIAHCLISGGAVKAFMLQERKRGAFSSEKPGDVPTCITSLQLCQYNYVSSNWNFASKMQLMWLMTNLSRLKLCHLLFFHSNNVKNSECPFEIEQ